MSAHLSTASLAFFGGAGRSEGTWFAPRTAQEATPAILIVDDDPVSQKVLLLQLRLMGYAPDVVADGRQALAAMRRRAYDVVFMDVRMPVMDGLEATRWIRAAQAAGETGFAHRPSVVAVTASAMSHHRSECEEAGMDAYLAKPFWPQALRAVLNQVLRTAE